MELLRLRDLSVDYRVKDGYLSAVRDVNLTINKAEIFAIVGESGCGKSTVAHSIMRLLDKRNARVTGEILFQGENLADLTDRQLTKIRGRDIGMIFQNPLDSLNPVYMTGAQVSEAILLDGGNKKEAWDKVVSLYQSVHMPDAPKRVRAFPHEMSGGMRQRVMIAMMLSRNPALLIADEPTTALDVTIEAQILEIILDLKRKYQTAVMMITHNFGLVAEIADRVAIMYAGEVVERGTVYEVFDHPAHPYTALLMEALPRMTKKEGRLRTIDGTVPRLLSKKSGCRFYNRCPVHLPVCENTDPESRTLSDTHDYRCHRDRSGEGVGT